ncbi:MAG: hypothetical protein JRC92_05035 [Deltaproteobacteria bacterium]|nr:hypothetical protein [Deltaproteobacteria bacterium]
MTKKLALLGGVLILAAALAVPALADRNDDRPRWAAGLSEAQVEELEAARLKFRNETLDLRRQTAQKQAELQALMLDPEATDNALLAKQNELNQLRNEFSQKRLLHQRGIQKRIPELGLGQGRGRGGRGPDRDFCVGLDRDRDRNRDRGSRR